MTDTAYLYQYFLEHSTADQDVKDQDNKYEEKTDKEQEVKSDGSHTRQHA